MVKRETSKVDDLIVVLLMIP
ncbi:hypothetical protein AZE42_00245 [Rhizopogon vesiculosus]|uniref:Uncharacterized protein n=1 Tax=Rhizopogon vesiculosus TaxID=180088 RepID=A0A1J8Q809_9AGAM|nr:hypothetical protein AZE42_00245 [Rhizopogon vesiculosus]